MLAEMSGPELGLWRRFFEVEPWGTPHEDLRFGYLLQLLYDAHRDKAKSRRLDPWDWLPACRPAGGARGDAHTVEGQHRIARAVAAMLQAGLEREQRLRQPGG